MSSSESKSALLALHGDIDRLAGELAEHHRERLNCAAGCAECCVDDLTVFEVEATRIRQNHSDLLAEGVPHAAGACAFLDSENRCRIYGDRPYVCRTQGLPLRWTESVNESDGAETVEYRDICHLNSEGPAIEALRAGECWTLGPVEERLQHIERTAGGDAKMQRVSLRGLFDR